jgi:ribonucleoside-diphosphate reductase alpha chain
MPGQTPEGRIREIAEAAQTHLTNMFWENNSKGPLPETIATFADTFERYMLNGWISLASPVWSNFGIERGLPISCNNSHFKDTTASILLKTAEIGMMTKFGAGTSSYLGELRGRGFPISGGGKSNGPVHFMEKIQTTTSVISQASVRRGHNAGYLPVDHPDIMEFLECREEGHPIQHMSIGVTITDEWMRSMLAGDKEKRKVWLRILRKRKEKGYPYIMFHDTVNNAAPRVYRDKGHVIKGSNMCIEIALCSNEYWSFVCCLSSLNAVHFNEWKHTNVVEIMTMFLDAVIEEYILKIEQMDEEEQFLMGSALRFARDQRAIGLGTLGYHSFLQSQMIPFESPEARALNVEIHRTMDERSLHASRQMAKWFGEPPLLKGYGERNVTRMAIAPTTSSAFILGQVSQSIEPLESNYFTNDVQKGKFSYQNPYLKELLAEKGKDTREVWDSILWRAGSVQHLDFLTEREKAVFKTFLEIDQFEIIQQAADRQKHLDQMQSLNIKLGPDQDPKMVHKLHVFAWEQGVKSLYYQRGLNKAQEKARALMLGAQEQAVEDAEACAACEA